MEVEKNIKNVVEENSNGDFNMQRQYIFTKNGFYPENTGEEIEDEESAEFLYDMGNIVHQNLQFQDISFILYPMHFSKN